MFPRARCLLISLAVALAACQPGAKPFNDGSESTSPLTKSPTATGTGTGTGDQVAPATVEARMVNDATRRVFRLTNGFTVILQQNKTAPVVSARVYVKAGSLTEQNHMAGGISHVLEHLVAGASSGKRKEDENTLLLLQIGNDSNAYTDADQTCYFITTSADKWPTAMDLLVDFTTNTSFTKEQFEREFKVVQREIEMDEAEADRIFYQHTLTTRYIESPVRHPIVGYKAAFQKITYEDCKSYYQSMYVPDNMIISLAGDFDLGKAEGLITDQLKNIRRRNVLDLPRTPEPPVTVPRTSVSRADVKQARVNWAFPTTDMFSPDLYATDTLASVLGGSESSILVRKLKDDLGLVASIDCSNPTPRYVQGELDISALIDPEKIPAAQKAVKDALEEVIKNGVSAEEVDRAKVQAAASLVYGNQTAEQQAIRNALDFIATGNIDYTESYVKHIQDVTPEQVLAAAKKYINYDHLLTTVVLPNDAKDPFAPASSATAAAGADVIIKKTTLKNGVTLLISRNTAAPLAAFNLYTVGGVLAENDQNNGIGSAMMALITRSTETRTHDDVSKFLDGTGTTLGAESGNNSFYLSMASMKDKAPQAFALFADMALHPKFDAAELNKIREPLLANIDTATEDWYGEAYAALKGIYYTNSPYKLLSVGKAEVVSKLTADQIRAHYQNYFLNPQKMVLAISGDIDPDQAAKWAAQFEAIPAHTPALNLSNTAVAGRTVQLHSEKQSATIMMAYSGMDIKDPDRYAAILLQTYLGGYSSPGGSVLFDTLRGKGLVYTVSASDISGVAGGMFLINALGEPQNASAIVEQIQNIVDDVKGGKLPDNLLAAAKEQTVTGEKLSKPTIADKSAAEALDEALGLGYDDSLKFEKAIRAVTKQDVIRVANKYLGKPTTVILTPAAKK